MHYKFQKDITRYVACYVEADSLEEALEIANTSGEWEDDCGGEEDVKRSYQIAYNDDEVDNEDDLEYDYPDDGGELTSEQLL